MRKNIEKGKIMFCKNCGKELVENVKYCPECGVKNEVESGNVMQAKDNGGEKVLMKGLCNRVKNPLFVQNGKAILTNRRLIYFKHGALETFTIGLLVNLTEGNFDFDILLKDVLSIEDGRQGVSKTIIVNTRSGEKYNFYFTNREEWKINIQGAIDKLN